MESRVNEERERGVFAIEVERLAVRSTERGGQQEANTTAAASWHGFNPSSVQPFTVPKRLAGVQ